MKEWNSLLEMLGELNHKNNYLILRNFESYLNNTLLKEHEDIDLLCDNRDKIFWSMGAEKIDNEDDIHVIVNIAGKRIRVDVRSVGDLYYDEMWERNMLNTRIIYNNKFYIMSDENYYYSILYHEFFHKRELKEEYVRLLISLSYKLGVEFDKKNLKKSLEMYMQAKGYKITGYISK